MPKKKGGGGDLALNWPRKLTQKNFTIFMSYAGTMINASLRTHFAKIACVSQRTTTYQRFYVLNFACVVNTGRVIIIPKKYFSNLTKNENDNEKIVLGPFFYETFSISKLVNSRSRNTRVLVNSFYCYEINIREYNQIRRTLAYWSILFIVMK